MAAPEEPWQQLPVPACPAMLTRRGNVIARGKFLDDLDIRRKAGAREDAFEQIVAQERSVFHPTIECRLEGVNVVDPLTGIRALAEQVLVYIGYRSGVGIESGSARDNALIKRSLGADRQGRRDPRLQHGVALDDASGVGVKSRPVQWMRDLANQPPRSE